MASGAITFAPGIGGGIPIIIICCCGQYMFIIICDCGGEPGTGNAAAGGTTEGGIAEGGNIAEGGIAEGGIAEGGIAEEESAAEAGRWRSPGRIDPMSPACGGGGLLGTSTRRPPASRASSSFARAERPSFSWEAVATRPLGVYDIPLRPSGSRRTKVLLGVPDNVLRDQLGLGAAKL